MSLYLMVSTTWAEPLQPQPCHGYTATIPGTQSTVLALWVSTLTNMVRCAIIPIICAISAIIV